MITPINNSTPLGIRLPKTKELSSGYDRAIVGQRYAPTSITSHKIKKQPETHMPPAAA